jgi:hypothetical protein
MAEEAAAVVEAARERDIEVSSSDQLSLWLVILNLGYWLKDMHRGRGQRARLPQPAPSP